VDGLAGREVHTLQPIGDVDPIVFHSLLVGIREGIDDEEDQDIESEDGDEFQALDDYVGHIVVRHDLVYSMGEENTWIVVCQLSNVACKCIDALRRKTSEDML
jgi:hypothetical protein